MTGFTFGNSQTYSRSVDQDGRVSSYSLGAANYGISFDLASRITGIAETGNPPNTNTYGYDALDRLTSAILPSTSYGYSYDGVGNRLTKAVGAGTETYTYSSTSNRIATLTPTSGPVRNFTLDANGSTTADGVNTYSYDVRGRMVQSVSSLGTTTYQVNALGQRVRKTNTLGDRVFHYSTQGHLITETTAAGATLKEYAWLGAMSVAVLVGTDRFYIYSDHLNTPRLVSNQSGQAMWRWDQQEPFGVNVPDENPSSLGAFEFPFRFPGQYADMETNLHYNMARDYASDTGRYIQSDPIGLQGGVNTYAYVLQHPLGVSDPTGLITGVGAYWHYCFGRGQPLTITYGEVGVTGVTAMSFSSVAGASALPCVNATIPISDSKPYSTTGAIYAVLGDVTLKLDGLLTTTCDCSWDFAGTLTVADDFYNMNPSTHRSRSGEAATTLGRLGGKVCGATPYVIKITGGQPIAQSGRMKGQPTCCVP